MANYLEVVVLRVGTLYVSFINTSVNLEGSSMMKFKLSIKASRAIMIILNKVVVSLQEDHFLGILAMVIILGQLDILGVV